MTEQLKELMLQPVAGAVPSRLAEFAEEGLRRSKPIRCFDFVPSDYCVLYAILSNLPRGRFCEWGSGIGIGIGLAAALGFEACGIEIDPELAGQSRTLLADFGLPAHVTTGSYFEQDCAAEFYFVYCWPGQMARVEEHFVATTPHDARLLIGHGAEDIRCKVRGGGES